MTNLTTSKALTWVFTLGYVLQVFLTGIVKTKYDIDLSSLMNYTTPLIGLICTFYFGKSGIENVVSIKNAVDFSSKSTQDSTLTQNTQTTNSNNTTN